MSPDADVAVAVAATAIGGGIILGVACWVASLVGLYLFERGENEPADS